MFVISITYKVDLSVIDVFVPEHIQFLDRYYNAGIFLLSGAKTPRTGGIILAQANSVDELDSILSQDPFYREKLADYEVTQFLPSKFSEGFKGIDTINHA